MDAATHLYPRAFNPLIVETSRNLPRQAAVIGAGTIGPDIGYYLKSAMPDLNLFLVDIQEKALENAQQRIEAYVQKAIDKKKMKKEKARAVSQNIYYTTDYESIKDCEMVLEAATENISLKKKIFQQVEEIVSPSAVITSNTSSIPAERIFSDMKRPQRTSVTHFFAPAWRSLPVEVVKWKQSSQETLDYLFWFFAATGKVPIMTEDAICFMLDRIFDNWCNESAYLLDQATASQIDKVAEEYVFAGPFFVLNMANGNPIIIETNNLQMEEGDHYKPALILKSVDKWLTHSPGAEVEVPEETREAVGQRLLGVLFSQTFDIIDSHIGTKEDLNLGCQIAFGFRNGPFDLMKSLGPEGTERIMNKFLEQRPGFPQARKDFLSYLEFNRHLLVDDWDGVKIITIRRPQAMNALNEEITEEILAVLKQFDQDPEVKGFVLVGYGTRAFSAGADIGRFPQVLGDKQAAVKFAKDCAKVQEFMDRINKPLVAAVNGMALGGGLELAIRCHSIVATSDAVFQFPEVTLGILPGLGGCIVPYRKWPQGAELFHEMVCLGKRLSAEQARSIGMVEDIQEDYFELVQSGVREVKRIDGNLTKIQEEEVQIPEIQIPDQPMAGGLPLSREAIEIIARTIKSGAKAQSFAEALEIGYEGFGEIACSDAAREGITAFMEKRSPQFKK